MKHPNVVAYARSLDLPAAEKAKIETHLKKCGECRDFVLFIRKVNASLEFDGRERRAAVEAEKGSGTQQTSEGKTTPQNAAAGSSEIDKVAFTKKAGYLTISAVTSNDVVVIRLQGRLLFGAERVLLRDVTKQFLALNAKNFVLDFAELVYMDSGGLGSLFATYHSVGTEGGSVKVAGCGYIFSRMGMGRLTNLFAAYEDVDQAVKSFKSFKPAMRA